MSLKNSCNEKLLKIGGAEVGETKRQAGKEEALWKGFLKKTIQFLRALNPCQYKPRKNHNF